MTGLDIVFTDKPLKKREYYTKDVFGSSVPDCNSGSEILFSKITENETYTVGSLFPKLKKYKVWRSVRFGYDRLTSSEECCNKERTALNWLFDMIRNHLSEGATKFYYACLWYDKSTDEESPEFVKIDLDTFELPRVSFVLERDTVFEFVYRGGSKG